MLRTFPSLFTWSLRSHVPIGRSLKRPLHFSLARLLSVSPSRWQQLNRSEKLLVNILGKPALPVEKKEIPVKPDIRNELYTIPNILTMTRIAATPFIGYFIATGHSTAAISVFVYSCVTDFVDGQIARRCNMKSVLGSILDPAADKFLMTVSTVALSMQNIMPWYIGAVIIGRDVMLSFMAFYIRYTALPPPKTMKRFLDMSITTHTVHPNLLGKVNTALQMFYIGGLVFLPGIEYLVGGSDQLSNFFDVFGIVVGLTTTASGLSYIFSRNAIKSIR